MFHTVTEKKKRGGRRVVGTSVDLSNLTSGYYQSVIGGLAFVNNIASKGESKLRVLSSSMSLSCFVFFSFLSPAHEVGGGGEIVITMSGQTALRPCFVYRWYLRNRQKDCFHIAYAHPLGDVYVPFGGYDFDRIFYLQFWGHCWPLN